MAVEDRLADMLRRHGPDSPNARAHDQRAPVIRAAVERTRTRLERRGGAVDTPTSAVPPGTAGCRRLTGWGTGGVQEA